MSLWTLSPSPATAIPNKKSMCSGAMPSLWRFNCCGKPAYTGLSHTRRRWLHGGVAQASDLEHVAAVIAAHHEAGGQLQR